MDEDEAGESARGIESHPRINQKREGGAPGGARGGGGKGKTVVFGKVR
jgi:hypothetical protein